MDELVEQYLVDFQKNSCIVVSGEKLVVRSILEFFWFKFARVVNNFKIKKFLVRKYNHVVKKIIFSRFLERSVLYGIKSL